MTIKTKYDVRRWFMAVPLEQAVDTFRVVGGIIEARVELELEPKRKRRSDSGKARPRSQQ